MCYHCELCENKHKNASVSICSEHLSGKIAPKFILNSLNFKAQTLFANHKPFKFQIQQPLQNVCKLKSPLKPQNSAFSQKLLTFGVFVL